MRSCGVLTLAEHHVPTKPLYHSPSHQDRVGGENKVANPMWVKKNSCLIQQRLCMEAKENKKSILYFPSAGDIQLLPGK